MKSAKSFLSWLVRKRTKTRNRLSKLYQRKSYLQELKKTEAFNAAPVNADIVALPAVVNNSIVPEAVQNAPLKLSIPSIQTISPVVSTDDKVVVRGKFVGPSSCGWNEQDEFFLFHPLGWDDSSDESPPSLLIAQHPHNASNDISPVGSMPLWHDVTPPDTVSCHLSHQSSITMIDDGLNEWGLPRVVATTHFEDELPESLYYDHDPFADQIESTTVIGTLSSKRGYVKSLPTFSSPLKTLMTVIYSLLLIARNSNNLNMLKRIKSLSRKDSLDLEQMTLWTVTSYNDLRARHTVQAETDFYPAWGF